jgi:hypothetical protein
MHNLFLALASSGHHSSVLKIILGVVVLIVSRGLWFLRARNRRRG